MYISSEGDIGLTVLNFSELIIEFLSLQSHIPVMQYRHQRIDYNLDGEKPDLKEALEKLVEKYGKRPFNCMTKASNDDNRHFG